MFQNFNIKVDRDYISVYIVSMNAFREGWQEIARGKIFPPPGDSVMGETLFRDTGCATLPLPTFTARHRRFSIGTPPKSKVINYFFSLLLRTGC